jgi:hypothetical protein
MDRLRPDMPTRLLQLHLYVCYTSDLNRSNRPREGLEDLCAGALIHPKGGAYLPWGPYLAPDDVHRMRTERVTMDEALSDLERWPDELCDDILSPAIPAPLSVLLTHLHHFTELLMATRAEPVASDALDRRTWKMVDFGRRRTEYDRKPEPCA